MTQNIFFGKNLWKSLIVLSLLQFFALPLWATHIRAGEITAQRISNNSLRYRFTLTVYTDNDSPVDDPQATFLFGDGTQATVDRAFPKTNIGNNSSINVYIVEHTFPGPGEYRITYTQPNRNGGVLNMTQSDQTRFSVETVLLIDPFLGLNSTPQLLVAPLDLACVGQRFTHNAGAFDADGDSLSYRLTVPKRSPTETVLGYLDPNQVPPVGTSEAGGVPQFRINAITGDLIWDSPSVPGEYNVAFVIEEWRNGVRIGYVVRDMQIIVLDCNNRRPDVLIPADTCVTAGDFVSKTIRGFDPDGHPVTLTAEGGILELNFANKAVFITPIQPQPNPASGQFNWQTDCSFIREQPYQVVFKAEDDPPRPQSRKLADVKTWNVTIVGPPPTNLKATAGAGRSITLSWDSYTCTNADSMIIWRREGCSTWNPANCEIGAPTYTGYVIIGKVPISQTTFTDNNRGQGLKRGLKYSYRVSATFPQPAGGGGYVSNQACLNVPIDAPLPIRVSVEKTGANDGEILVKWTRPFDLTLAQAPAPYRYRLFRAEGLRGTSFTEIYSETDPTATKDSLEFKDTGLNTQDLAYSYRVVLDNGSPLAFKDSSDRASSVRLTAEGTSNSVRLTWAYNVPWTNNNQKHAIYRQVNGVFEKIDEIEVGATGRGEYFDRGTYKGIKLKIDEVYCYYIETRGTFDNPLIKAPLFNKSQIACASPIDTTAPCPPILALDSINCDTYNPNAPLRNTLTWQKVITGGNCEDDINFYRLYFSPTDQQAFQLLIETPSLNYIHSNLQSLAGCYVVTAVDFAGNESDFSNEVCKDNCVLYSLPNVITPNEDGKNDIFKPFPDYRFVESVEFIVYSRYGTEVYRSNEIEINWNGEGTTGELPSGAYYYVAKVRFITLRPQEAVKELKGWIQLIR